MKKLIVTAGVRGVMDDDVYVVHVDDDVRAHHVFIKIRKALRERAKRLNGVSIAEDNTASLAFWQGDFHFDLVFEIEDVKLPA